jgi:hypothetical protein
LDSSDAIENDHTVVNDAVYPYGTNEEFPVMIDSDHTQLSQSAHGYVECSNAGKCNRVTGECECYKGFEGVSCQRLTCPTNSEHEGNICSGHGICQTLRRIAKTHEGSQYRLWDKESTTACVCDKGFYGFDCSMRYCPKGLDPLYFDDIQTVQYPFYFFTIMTTSPTYDITDGFGNPGYFNLQLFDTYDQPYFTRTLRLPITCNDLISAIEEVPNNLIPTGATRCYHNSVEKQNAITSRLINVSYMNLYKSYISGTRIYVDMEEPASESAGYVSLKRNLSSNALLTGDLFLLQFYGNPGNFRQPILNMFSDGKRSTLQASTPGGVVVAGSWTNGQQSLDIDYFPIRCSNVQVKLKTIDGKTYLWGNFLASLMFKCNGVSDYDDSNNIEEYEYEYDFPTIDYPYVIKLVRSVADPRDGYRFALIVWEAGRFDFQAGDNDYVNSPTHFAFRVLHPIHNLEEPNNDDILYDVFASRGKVHRIQPNGRAEFDFASNHIYLRNISTFYENDNFSSFYNEQSGGNALSCEGNIIGQNTSTFHCLDIDDYFFLADPFETMNNPPFLNMFRATSMRKVVFQDILDFNDYQYNNSISNERKTEDVLITTDLHTNGLSTVKGQTNFQVFRFIPNNEIIYNYHAECSGRGLCNTFEGICECFHGYTGNACSTQETISS